MQEHPTSVIFIKSKKISVLYQMEQIHVTSKQVQQITLIRNVSKRTQPAIISIIILLHGKQNLSSTNLKHFLCSLW